METKKCSKCGEVKPLSEFVKGTGKDGLAYWCKECHRAHYQAHKKERCAYQRAWYQTQKTIVFDHYGRTCQCCGLTFPQDLLTIDHVNNDGHLHRKEHGGFMYPWAIKNNFPPDLQTLCYNCNCAKAYHLGPCPCNHGQVFIDAVKALGKDMVV